MKKVLRFLKDVLLKNWGLKLTSILLSFALWLMVSGNQGERVVQAPLTYQIPFGMDIVSERPKTIDVTVQGSFSNLTGETAAISYNIDLQNASEGDHTVELSTTGVRLSPASGLRVIRVSPARITLKLERVIKKTVPVKVPYAGTPAKDTDLYQLTYTPTSVTISGPRSNVDRINVVETDPVSIANRDSSFQTTANLNIEDADIHSSPGGPVIVNVDLGPHRVAHTIRVPVTVLNDASFVVSPSTLAVRVLVPITYEGSGRG
jgi:YbbR domain-containing protein